LKLSLERLEFSHAARFLESVARSTELHFPWIARPSTPDSFRKFVEKHRGERNISYVAVNDNDDLIGCINLSEIVRGSFQSAYLGFHAFVPFAGQGLMKQAMKLVLAQAFTTLGLHRLEANIQPNNEPSKRLVQSLGFRHEGYSPQYLKLGGQWCDHERFAITADVWHA